MHHIDSNTIINNHPGDFKHILDIGCQFFRFSEFIPFTIPICICKLLTFIPPAVQFALIGFFIPLITKEQTIRPRVLPVLCECLDLCSTSKPGILYFIKIQLMVLIINSRSYFPLISNLAGQVKPDFIGNCPGISVKSIMPAKRSSFIPCYSRPIRHVIIWIW